jgi:hypothetical protein
MDGSPSPFRAAVVPLDGPEKVTGAARYTFDVSLPGMLHAKGPAQPTSACSDGCLSQLRDRGVGRDEQTHHR